MTHFMLLSGFENLALFLRFSKGVVDYEIIIWKAQGMPQ